MHIRKVDQKGIMQKVSFSVRHALSQKTLTGDEKFLCRNFEFEFKKSMSHYLQIECSVTDLEDDIIFPAYFSVLSRRQIAVILLVGTDLPIESAGVITYVKAHADSTLIIPFEQLHDRMIVLIGFYSREKREELEQDSFVRVVNKVHMA